MTYRLAIAFALGIPLMWMCWWMYQICLVAMRAWLWAKSKVSKT